MNRTSLKALIIVCVLALGAPRVIYAASLTIGWTPSAQNNVAGYMISYGTVPGQYTASIKVGNLSSYVLSGLGDGTVYYFIVQAYNGKGELGDPLQEITGVSTGTSSPTVPPAPTNPATNAPTIICPSPQAISFDGKPVAVAFNLQVAGGTAPISATCSPASGSLFPVGTTPTTCTAIDAHSLTASCSSSVVVTTYSPLAPGAPGTPGAFAAPPTIMCPAPSATSPDGKPEVLTFAPTVSGGTAPVSSSCLPASGSVFPVGSTALRCSAVDSKRLTASCSSSVVVTSATSAPPVGSGGGGTTAVFVHTDATTQGNWHGMYGSQGYGIINDSLNYPAFAHVTPGGNANWTWAASTADSRALQEATGSDRIAACWYSNTSFTIDLKLTDGASHQVALYSLDWDNRARVQRVDLLDAATGAVLDSRTLKGFHGGEYLVWNLRGHVTIRVTSTGGDNAVVSGLFFD